MEKSMFYTNFEPSSDNQSTCIKAIQAAKVDTLNPVYLLKKPISEKKRLSIRMCGDQNLRIAYNH